MSDIKNCFVFVVCGAREHIETLHFSLAALKQFTLLPIIVVTDKSKNEIPINHSNILNVTAPVNFSHHQSSIYLKTGLYKFLPKGVTYCYLDTDVVAVSKEVDEVFNQKKGPITFAVDHCSLSQFSPHAVNCGCADKNKADRLEIQNLLVKFGYSPLTIPPVLIPGQKRLQQQLQVVKHSPVRLLISALRYLISPNTFRLNNEFKYHRLNNYWTDAEGNIVQYEVPNRVIKQIEKNTAWRWKMTQRRWISPEGKDIEWLACEHLHDAIFDKFNIDFNETWQHWNGGVFLFDDSGHEFMQAWHQNTLLVFKDPYWKTRDQGTLIATTWQLGLQNSALLPKKFNFIAYFYNPALMISDDKSAISDNALVTKYNPAFIHVFHHFGDAGWDVWDWIELKLKGYKI